MYNKSEEWFSAHERRGMSMSRLEMVRVQWLRNEIVKLQDAQWRLGFRTDREEAIRTLRNEIKSLTEYK